MTTAAAPAPVVTNGSIVALKAGDLVTTGISDKPIDGAVLKQAMIDQDVGKNFLPDVPSDADAFSRACTSVQTKRVKGEKLQTRITVGRVKEDSDECVYQLTLERVDKTNRVIDHPQAMLAVFRKASPDGRQLIFEPTQSTNYLPIDADAAQRLEAGIRAYYDLHRGRLPGSKVRAIMRQLFREMHAVRWSTTNSVFFVPPEHAELLGKIKAVLTAVYDTRFEFTTASVLRTDADLQTISEKHNESVRAEAEQMMQALRERLQDPSPVRKNTLEKFLTQLQELRGQQTRLNDLLGHEQQVAEQALGLVAMQVAALTERASK